MQNGAARRPRDKLPFSGGAADLGLRPTAKSVAAFPSILLPFAIWSGGLLWSDGLARNGDLPRVALVHEESVVTALADALDPGRSEGDAAESPSAAIGEEQSSRRRNGLPI